MNLKEFGQLEDNVLKLSADLNRFSLNGIKLRNLNLKNEPLIVDGSNLINLDSAGIAFFIYLKRIANEQKISVKFQNMPETFFKLSALYEVEFNG